MKNIFQPLLFLFLAGITGLLIAGARPYRFSGRPDGAVSKPDTLIIRNDTLIDRFVKDSTYNAVFRRDTNYRPKTDTALARTDSNRLELPTVRTFPMPGLAVCPGAAVTVSFATSGRFNPDNAFVVQLVDADNKVVNLNEPAKTNPITVSIPTGKTAGHRYQLRVASTSPAVTGSAQPLRILPLPTARLELPDGGTTTTIVPGQSATVRVALTGAGPWSFMLSDSTTVTNVMQTPYELTVTPKQPTVYKVLNVNTACGTGTTSGEVIVNVNENPAPALALKTPAGGYRVCTGTPFQIPFSATGRYNAGNGFVAQMADSSGNWTTISSHVAASPITTRLPYGTTPGRTYRLRVVSTFPTIASDSTILTVASQATALLRSDTLRIDEGKSADLTVDFGGSSPWFVLLSDGTYENGITKTPHTIKVNPINPTAYTISSAGGACGVGEARGQAFVRVNIPPSTITTGNLSNRTVCHGTEVTVPFSITGRFYANNKWIVQVGDSSGRFVSVATTYNNNTLKAVINPASLPDTISTLRVRVVSTSPAIVGTETTIKVLAPNLGQALMQGEAAIRPGQTAKVRVAFKNGLPPWSFTLSDGTQVTGTFLNPYVLTVAPVTSTEYTITKLSSSCGVGMALGKSMVKVDTN